MSRPRYLTKSRFKLACECPTKLYFTGKKEFGNTKLDNSFLEALAEGGFQVGELAKLYYEGGAEISTLDAEEAIRLTNEQLQKENVTLYEPAIQVGDLLVRVDILVKKGNSVRLIEVKAKSFDPGQENPFYNKRPAKNGEPKISSAWEPYLLDITFQTFVARAAHPEWSVTSSLLLADKTSHATVDGINQRFFLSLDEKGRSRAEVQPGTTLKDLGARILVEVPVDEEVSLLLKQKCEGLSFQQRVKLYSDSYKADEMLPPMIGSQCKGCEFRIDDKLKSKGLQSGFEHCWKMSARLKANDFDRPFVFEIWNFRKAQGLIEENKFFIENLCEEDISPSPKSDEPGLSSSERQWIQVQKVLEKDATPYLDVDGLAAEMRKWHYPLNFIDFETTMVALPFHAGRRPYEQIAFQFSHHTITQDGQIEHRNEYINRNQGKFPNFDFVRALKKALSENDGTIFRFAAHENTVLCQILEQLRKSDEKDRNELVSWIRSITQAGGDSIDKWEGPRNMVDMCDLVKKYFYHPSTHGSNSIKKVLPAVLLSSELIKNRYSKPIYGASNGIKSKNYRDWQWIKLDAQGNPLDPYKLLPPIFSDLDLETMDGLITDGSIADGGAAMTAYARMQFTQMSETERERVTKALLKYCELDTFAMVMIYEYWRQEIKQSGEKAA